MQTTTPRPIFRTKKQVEQYGYFFRNTHTPNRNVWELVNPNNNWRIQGTDVKDIIRQLNNNRG